MAIERTTDACSALYRDSCLYIVPGSHKTPRAPEQRKHSETTEPPNDPCDMPGVMQVDLKRSCSEPLNLYVILIREYRLAGETVFYNSNILHCAVYDHTTVRATLHASMGDVRGGATRARNVLQHGLDWIKGEEFKKSLEALGDGNVQKRAFKMWTNLLKMQEGIDVGNLGYSLSS